MVGNGRSYKSIGKMKNNKIYHNTPFNIWNIQYSLIDFNEEINILQVALQDPCSSACFLSRGYSIV